MSEETTMESNDSPPSRVGEGSTSSMETRVCVVGKKNFENLELMQALEALKIPTSKTEDLKDILKTISDEVETVFVCDPFDGEEFLSLHKEEHRIIGPPVVLSCAKNNQALPYNSRPLYCSIMANHIICFTGFKKKEEMGKLCNLVHHMGGSIRGELSGRVTHLVASSVHGHKYGAAVSLGKPIMTADWIHACWNKRFELDVSASSKEMDQFKMAPFYGLSLSFYGFSEEEQKHMEESTEQQGGKFVDSSSESCTHVVVEDGVKELPDDITNSTQAFVVKQEWFWASIHMDGCADESLYPFTSTPRDQSSNQKTPASVGRKRKRKKIKESDISELLSPDSPLFKSKRKSGDLLSVSGSLLDYTLLSPSTPVTGRGDATPSGTISPLSTPQPAPTARQQVTMELLQTEKNYVGILTTILKVFKEPLETDPRGPIVPTESIKTIFGSLSDILDVHTKIMEELEAIVSAWSEEKSIGKVILNHADVLCKVYPPFVNYFEMSKETVNKHDRENPRFHAFLKACLSKSECGRQSLAELLIRPVQRLPSMTLLLSDILKRTDNNNPDHLPLMQASDALKNVMMHINEDKRKTEGQVQMFEILRDVDGCPAYILSSHRSYVTKADTFELSDGICGKGEAVTIFLFNDSLEVTKRRGIKMNRAMKSPAATRTPQKAYKHLEFVPLSHVKRVVNIRDSEDCPNLFGIIYRGANEMKEKLLMFKLINDDVKKEDWLHKLTVGLANTNCTADTENFMTTVDPQELMLSKSDLSTGGTLSRAVRVAKRTTRKVSRALSMTKTPRKSTSVVRRSSSNVTPSREPFSSASPLVTSSKYNQSLPIGLRGRAMSACEAMDPELMDVDMKVRRSMSISEER